jgi:putative FmdB family regulatory protein
MPTYEFVCHECKKSFTSVMSVAEMEKEHTVCPQCKSKKTEQKPAKFFAMTAKKS